MVGAFFECCKNNRKILLAPLTAQLHSAVSNEFLAAAHSKWMFHEYKNYLNCPLSLFFWNGSHETKIKRLFIWFWLVTRTELIGSGQDSSETTEHETQTGYLDLVYLPPMMPKLQSVLISCQIISGNIFANLQIQVAKTNS